MAGAAEAIAEQHAQLGQQGFGALADIEQSRESLVAGQRCAAAEQILDIAGEMDVLGMDQLAYKLEAAGVASSVSNHTLWSGQADDMIAKYKAGNREPIILMGHSAGADATISVARKLAQYNVPVALIVNFDPVAPDAVPNNVKQIVNYYVPAGWGRAVSADPRFKGKLANVNESSTTNHFSIDKDDSLQRQAIARVLAVTGGGIRRKPAAPKPAQVSAAPAQ